MKRKKMSVKMECARKAHAANFCVPIEGKEHAFCDLIIPFSLLKNSAKVVILFSIALLPVYCSLRKKGTFLGVDSPK